jgi:radical S-adenosyl methionine domain-containing protein 2
MTFIAYLLVLATCIATLYKLHCFRRQKCPVAVNYHFTRQCNKSCGFCFHTATTSHMERPDRAKEGLLLLQQAGMRKINFAGGEPFLHSKFLGEMIDYCKRDLNLESVSIVTNGSLVKESFLKAHGHNIDILAVSCDSFDEATNIEIGRGSGNQVTQLYRISEWCRRYGIKFKINTVVCRLNYMEDMNKHIDLLQPFRWKCFQVLIVAGENNSNDTLRDGRKFEITDQEYQNFCERHSRHKSLVAESNRLMAKSYLILDEYMRFLDRDGRDPSQPIQDVGVHNALSCVSWDEEAFKERGGVYDWKRDDRLDAIPKEELEW